jgi:serine/threonine-protein kinase
MTNTEKPDSRARRESERGKSSAGAFLEGLGPGDTAALGDVKKDQPRYVPVDEVARGGMGTVLRVWDRLLHRMTAKKVLRLDSEEGDSGGTTLRFLREARITGQLAHPGVVPIHDLEVSEDGAVSFTMSLIEGRTFEEVISGVHSEDAEWTVGRALQVILKVCEVVAFAHSRGVIHRVL